jgi:hypothetical protein
MVSNALTGKGAANRRPAVCKYRPPPNCPFGELILETISLHFELHWIWNLLAAWTVLPLDPFQVGTAHLTVNRGVLSDNDFDVNTTVPFGITVDSDPGPFACVLFCSVKTPAGCEYAAAASIVIPAAPS